MIGWLPLMSPLITSCINDKICRKLSKTEMREIIVEHATLKMISH